MKMLVGKSGLFGVALISACISAQAESMKPGLWEQSQQAQMNPEFKAKLDAQMKSAQSKMDEKMASLTPQQRKAIQDAMAKQSNLKNGDFVRQFCVTKEMAEKGPDGMTNDPGCTQQSKRDGKSVHVQATCVQHGEKSELEIKVLIVDPEHYTFEGYSSSNVQGTPLKTSFSGKAKWLATDCGKVTAR
jgi:hypothetical protein